jgi:hypothetical protein
LEAQAHPGLSLPKEEDSSLTISMKHGGGLVVQIPNLVRPFGSISDLTATFCESRSLVDRSHAPVACLQKWRYRHVALFTSLACPQESKGQ